MFSLWFRNLVIFFISKKVMDTNMPYITIRAQGMRQKNLGRKEEKAK